MRSSDASGSEDAAPTLRTLTNLPNSVLTTIMEQILKVSNAGQVVKLALACRALLRAVTEAEGLWEQLSVSHGWSRGPAGPRPLLPRAPAGGPAPAPPLELDTRWFEYYTQRMACRRSVRRFMRLYVSFLSRPSSMSLMQGADPAAISACERRLGVPLPWQLWELYRFRSGQAPGAFVTFADDMRLLALDELVLERHPGLPELRQRLALMGVSQPAQLQRPGQGESEGKPAGGGAVAAAAAAAAPGPTHGSPAQTHAGEGAGAAGGTSGTTVMPAGGATAGGATAGGAIDVHLGEVLAVGYPAAAAAAYGDDGDERLVAVASNPSSSRRLMVTLNGQVYLARGMSIAFFSSSVAGMVQKLLT